METATEFRIVFIATESLDKSKQIARILVTESLAACCTIIPNTISLYSWEGSLNERQENVIMIKTTRQKLDQLKSRIVELHTDRVPEILAVNVDSGLGSYLEWINTTLITE